VFHFVLGFARYDRLQSLAAQKYYLNLGNDRNFKITGALNKISAMEYFF
jgi:hypothetical protein